MDSNLSITFSYTCTMHARPFIYKYQFRNIFSSAIALFEHMYTFIHTHTCIHSYIHTHNIHKRMNVLNIFFLHEYASLGWCFRDFIKSWLHKSRNYWFTLLHELLNSWIMHISVLNTLILHTLYIWGGFD